jgi:LacI family transcriptional regulator
MHSSRVTQQLVAEHAGVSRTTVSLVLNDVPDTRISDETRQLVLKTARSLGYYPDAAAERLARGASFTIALVWHREPGTTYRDVFLPEVLLGVTRAAQHYEYGLLFHPIEVGKADQGYVKLARGGQVDGMVLSGPRSQEPALIELYEDGFPLVLHGRLPGSDIPSVDVDNTLAGEMAVRHLVELGHTRIGMITNAPRLFPSAEQRVAGYLRGLEEADIEPDESLICEGQFDEASGHAGVAALTQLTPPPSAIFVASDLVAIGALRALHDRGLRVPDDVAVVGMDDISSAEHLLPALTTVHVPAFGLGWSSGELLIRLVEGEDPRSPHVTLDTNLVIRESCGASRTPSVR